MIIVLLLLRQEFLCQCQIITDHHMCCRSGDISHSTFYCCCFSVERVGCGFLILDVMYTEIFCWSQASFLLQASMASTFPPPSSSPPSFLCACFQQPKDQQKQSTSCYTPPLRPCWRLLVPIQVKLCVCRVPMCCQKRFNVSCSAASSEDSKKGAGSSEHTSNFAVSISVLLQKLLVAR